MANNKILIVENSDNGELYKRLIENNLNVSAVWVKNEAEALAAVEKDFFKLAVLDQRLNPEELGTNVFQKIKVLQPSIMGIMFSGKADAGELDRAKGELGYYKYVDKSNVLNLPEAVREALEIYDIKSLPSKTYYDRKPIYQFRKNYNPFHLFKVYLISSILVDGNYIFSERWKERKSAEAGNPVSGKVGIEMKKSAELEFKTAFEVSKKASSGIKILENNANAEIAAKLSSEIRTKVSYDIKTSSEISFTLAVPSIPEDTTKNYLASKSFETNQVYEKHLVNLDIVCNYCDVPETILSTLFIPTDKIYRRQIDVLRDGTKIIIDIGISTPSH